MIEKPLTLFQRMASQICEGLFDGLSCAFRNVIADHEVMARGFPETTETPPALMPVSVPAAPVSPVPIAPPADLVPLLEAYAKRPIEWIEGNVTKVDFQR